MRRLVGCINWCTKRGFYIFCCMGLMSISWMLYKIGTMPDTVQRQPTYIRQWHSTDMLNDPHHSHNIRRSDNIFSPATQQVTLPYKEELVVENTALLILHHNKQASSIPRAIVSSRWNAEIFYFTQTFEKPLSRDYSNGLFSVIVFEDLRIYLSMTKETRHYIDSYCKKFSVGIIFFSLPQQLGALSNVPILDFPLVIKTHSSIETYTVTSSPVADIAKPQVPHNVNTIKGWISFQSNHTTYQTLSYGTLSTASEDKVLIALLDSGQLDGVKRIFFGQSHDLWIHKILFLDALAFLTGNALKMDTTKYIQIDIDDMFLGKNGTKMKPSDVKALKDAQTIWRENYVPGFSFYIGFSARSFRKGLAEEQEGDEEMIRQASNFNWFDHTYSHIQVHKYTDLNAVIKQMELSKEFAKAHGMEISSTYSVAPHHSGVYPTDDLLYEAWKRVWNITVTSTEEYPHLKPFHSHRGFIYKGIKVLPREVCGLYTTNLYYNSYPGGPSALEYNILGGQLFESVLYNYLNIYMTHQQNYGSDRLSIYTFDKLFKLFHKSTTLKLQGAPPEQMAEKYFNRYPEERQPLWLNPCVDPRHREIWNPAKQCSGLPSLLVVGPQKTGSTALYTFLKLHPDVSANSDSLTTYEELQFFGSPNYNNGLDWYMSFFKSESKILFEKSATYFDKEIVPKQASSLLPEARIIIILLDPIDRAFSWYHHQRAHGDTTALTHSFYDVVTSSDKEKRDLNRLKTHLIRPGFYFEHIQRWRQHYPDSQIMYVDGERLKSDPVAVMGEVQTFLQTGTRLDYNKVLRFDEKKGFYCLLTNSGHSKCLGSGKGRSKQYGEVDKQSQHYLQSVFSTPNAALKALLQQVNSPLPAWLVTSN